MENHTDKGPDLAGIEIDIEKHHNKAISDKTDSSTMATSKKVATQICSGVCCILAFVRYN